ncbi:hypothetical protein [Pedobacter agri]|uniref:hypothetical protein n=1 Tax=Pedobacter agri TaxID=454586 RepID=UPI00292D3B31|nr:hypothetical protein [Pedobacter agri]
MEQNLKQPESIEVLIKRKDLLRGVMLGLGIVYLVAFGILVYLAVTKGLSKVSIALIPVCLSPLTLLPLLLNFNSLKKVIASKNA